MGISLILGEEAASLKKRAQSSRLRLFRSFSLSPSYNHRSWKGWWVCTRPMKEAVDSKHCARHVPFLRLMLGLVTKQIPYVPAAFLEEAFNCPHCQAFAKQRWGHPHKVVGSTNYGQDAWLALSRCDRCEKFLVWVDRKMVFPAAVIAPPPNPDIPGEIATDYDEARTISSQSPRGAAALLRLCIQKLCKYLGETGENINSDIGSLVSKGLPAKIQKALDVVRVVGNNAVHPGQIDLNDTPEVAHKLFGLVNVVADVMISQPKQINALYDSVVPEGTKEAIMKRDGSKSAVGGALGKGC